MNINDPSWLADMIITSLSLDNDLRKELMVLSHPADRLQRVNKILAEELDVLELEDEIQAQVQTEVKPLAPGVLSARTDEGDPDGTG